MAEEFKKRSDIQKKREREDEVSRELDLRKKVHQPQGGLESDGPPDTQNTEKLMELVRRAEPMIEQLNTLYRMYLSGAEKLPPNERRKQLDQMMNSITMFAKPTPAIRFMANGVYQRYVTYRERWDRMLRDLEDGKIKRGQKF